MIEPSLANKLKSFNDQDLAAYIDAVEECADFARALVSKPNTKKATKTVSLTPRLRELLKKLSALTGRTMRSILEAALDKEFGTKAPTADKLSARKEVNPSGDNVAIAQSVQAKLLTFDREDLQSYVDVIEGYRWFARSLMAVGLNLDEQRRMKMRMNHTLN